MARGKAPRLSNPPTILPDESWTELLEMGGGGLLGAYGMGGFPWWGDYRGAQVKGQCPLST